MVNSPDVGGRVNSGVPQESVLGPILFNLFINDLELGVSGEVGKFADDTKFFQVVKTQRDFCKLGEWASKWQLQFSVSKCKVMHVGAKRPNFKSKLMGSELVVTKQERDLGTVVGSSMKMSTQCVATVKKANSMLGIIRKGIENKMASIILPLYKS